LNKNENDQPTELRIPEFYNIRRATDLITGESYGINQNIFSQSIGGTGYKILKLEK